MHQASHAVAHSIDRQLSSLEDVSLAPIQLEMQLVGNLQVIEPRRKWGSDNLCIPDAGQTQAGM